MSRRDRPPTVLMTADAVGGVWQYALALCRGLPEFRFVLAVMGPPPSPSQRESVGRLPNVGLEESPCRLEWMQGGDTDLAASRAWLSRLAERHSADLLHINGYAHAVNDSGRPVLAVAHSDVWSWWRAVHREEAPASWEPYRRAVMGGLRAADRVVALSRAVLDDLARHYRFDRQRGSVIYNGIDQAAFPPGAKRPVVMAAGRLWDQAKNLALLDRIAGELDWPIEIAGDANHPEGGTARFEAARLLGMLSPADMAERLGAAAIFAAPAKYEPFGLGILEAAAAGCVLVLGDIASLREIWDGAALFAPSDDPAAWRRTLAALIADNRQRAALAGAARERAMVFTRERMAGSYGALYRELLGNPLSAKSQKDVGYSGAPQNRRTRIPRTPPPVVTASGLPSDARRPE